MRDMLNSNMLDKVISKRFELLRFPLIVCVIYIHSAYVGFVENSNIDSSALLVELIKYTISEGIARLAVPAFFLLSGFFFFINFNFSFESFINKLRRRFSTLFVPYVIWNGMVLILVLSLQSIPYTEFLVSEEKKINVISFFSIMDLMFRFDGLPISYQFWFIRDLIITILLVPLISYFLRLIPLLSLVIVMCVWYFSIFESYLVTAICFFYVGAFLSHNQYLIYKFDRYGKEISIIYLLILAVDVYFGMEDTNKYIHSIGIVIGIIMLLYLTRCIHSVRSLSTILVNYSKYSFFVFAGHEPLLTLIRKSLSQIVSSHSAGGNLFIYLISPVIAIMILITIYNFLEQQFPNFLMMICGKK